MAGEGARLSKPGTLTLGAVRRGAVSWWRQSSLTVQFIWASLVVVVLWIVIIGAWVGQQIETGVRKNSADMAALYVESIVSPFLQSLAAHPSLDQSDMSALDRLLAETPLGERIVTLYVWSPSGEVLYSPKGVLTGQRFEVNRRLKRALDGQVTATISALNNPRHVYEREHWSRLLDVYAPVREDRRGRMLAAMEFYQELGDLESEIAAARWRSWGVVAGATLAAYLLLASIVRRGSKTIARQQRALREQVAQLSILLEQNTRLQERVRVAAGRSTALNEQALRRVSADLHDGPGQALALALLRLRDVQSNDYDPQPNDVLVARAAVQDALDEIRTISAGLRLPELAPLQLAAVAERAVRDHERRTGTKVELQMNDLPSQALLPIKIALFRALQEALSNATRHGQGIAICADIRVEAGCLHLMVSDGGPGFANEAQNADGHLGLAGMRERAELLGGGFFAESGAHGGAIVNVYWPLIERRE